MTTTPLTGYYSTGYYYNSISPRFITSPALSAIIIAKAKDDGKLYAYNRHSGLPALSGTRLYIDPLDVDPAAPPIIGDGGVVTGSVISITTALYTLAGELSAELMVSYDLLSLAGTVFWMEGLSSGSGMWDNGGTDGGPNGVTKYVDGSLANGIYEDQFYKSGNLGSIFRASDGKAYRSGTPFSGTVPGGLNSNPLNWPNFDNLVPAPRITTLFTNGLSSLPPPILPQRFENGRLYFSNRPFTGNAILNSDGLVLKYNNTAARSTTPVTIPLTAVNARFSSALRRNTAVVSFGEGYPITGNVNALYFSKGMSTINVGLTSHTVYFNNGTVANGIIGNQVFSFGTKISG
jgi:hypothetical protein